MPDVMQINTVLAGLVLAVAVYTDLREGKIKNWLTVPAIIVGPILCLAVGGLHSALLSLAGIGVMLLVAGVVVAFGLIGGGDAKLLIAVGSMLGLHMVKGVLLFTGVAGGLLALSMMVLRCSPTIALGQLVRTFVYYRNLRTSCSVVPASGIKVPYSLSIAAGTVAALILKV